MIFFIGKRSISVEWNDTLDLPAVFDSLPADVQGMISGMASRRGILSWLASLVLRSGRRIPQSHIQMEQRYT
jgi:hypothetical protein